MVGVPGKSKGCSTCRRRKKGCGQERPSCRQCLNSGHVCGGYERSLTFILHPASKEVEEAVFLPVRPAPPILTLLPALDRATVLLQCRDLFFNNFLPHGQCVVRDKQILKSNHPSSWVELIPGFQGEESSLELAFSALSVARLGRNNNDTRLVKESNKFYGKALKSLQRALYDPKRMCSEQVIAACQTLGLYETYEGDGGRSAGWISHAQGAARIIEMRGPHACSTRSAHFLLVGSRVPIIYSATVRRKGTFLAEEEWLTLPWSSIRRTGMDILVDISTQIPGLLEDLDNVKKNMSFADQQTSLIVCLQKFQTAQKSLAAWLLYRKANAVPIIKIHESKGDHDIYPLTHHLVFENHLFVGSNVFYWSMNLVVSATIIETLLLLARSGYRASDLAQAIATTQLEARQYATNIVQSVSYCLQPEMGDLGINMITFPICLAFKFFSSINETKICLWLARVCDDMNHVGLRLGLEEDNLRSGTSPGDESNQDLRVSKPWPISHQDDSDDNSQDISLKHIPQTISLVQISDELSVRSTKLKEEKVEPMILDAVEDEAMFPGALIKTTSTYYDENDHDYHGDADSTCDAMSPTSGISHTSSNSSRGSSSIAALGVPRHLAQMQMANASKGDFTFVSEDPSSYYIISEQRKT